MRDFKIKYEETNTEGFVVKRFGTYNPSLGPLQRKFSKKNIVLAQDILDAF